MGHRGLRILALLASFTLLAGTALVDPVAAQDKPRYGGELVFVVPSEPPSYDAHQEETFGLIHPMEPHYNKLVRVEPFDKTSTKPFPDLAESWNISKDGLIYTFKLLCFFKQKTAYEMTSKDV